MNLLFIKYFHEHPGTFKTYLWIYWLQSVLIGIFNFFNLLTLNKDATGGFSFQEGPVDKKTINGCMAFFFLIHYGGFHIGYCIFIFVQFHKSGIFDWQLFKYAAMGLLVNQLIWFIQNKLRQRNMPQNASKIFFLPYLRIIPMHLALLIPAFYTVSSMGLFLVLKMAMDILMHLTTTSWYWRDEERTIGDIAHTDLM